MELKQIYGRCWLLGYPHSYLERGPKRQGQAFFGAQAKQRIKVSMSDQVSSIYVAVSGRWHYIGVKGDVRSRRRILG